MIYYNHRWLKSLLVSNFSNDSEQIEKEKILSQTWAQYTCKTDFFFSSIFIIINNFSNICIEYFCHADILSIIWIGPLVWVGYQKRHVQKPVYHLKKSHYRDNVEREADQNSCFVFLKSVITHYKPAFSTLIRYQSRSRPDVAPACVNSNYTLLVLINNSFQESGKCNFWPCRIQSVLHLEPDRWNEFHGFSSFSLSRL